MATRQLRCPYLAVYKTTNSEKTEKFEEKLFSEKTMQQQGSESIEMSEPSGVLPNEVKPTLTSKCVSYILHTFCIYFTT